MSKIWIAALAALSLCAAPSGDPRVTDAAMKPDRLAVRALIDQHVDVNFPQSDGTTALHWAAHWNDMEMADLLLRAGANAKVANRYGITAISEAATNASPVMIEKLLKAGADPEAEQAEGETVLMTAARTGSAEAVKLLIDHGAKVNPRENWRWQTPLMWAAAEDHADVVSLLISRGADVNATSAVFDFTSLKPKPGSVGMNFPRGGFTPLLFAARQGSMESARILLEHGANVNQGDPDSSTPLLVAIVNFHYDLAAYLIGKGANPNIADKMGRAPLYAAIDMRNMDTSTRPSPKMEDKLDATGMIKLLLAKGADVDAKLSRAIPPRGVLDGADGTMGAGATPFIRAARSDDAMVMRLLLDKGADWKIATSDNVTPLIAAAGISWRDGKTKGTEEGALECIKMMLDLGADINAKTARTEETALHGAAGRGADKIVQFLADHGANVHLKDKQGRTPYDTALGLGAGVGGVRSPHESTGALLQKLIAAKPAQETASVAKE